MLLSFGFIRFSTRMIRAEVSWWPGNVTPGGLHIHHLVFGIVLMMLAGFLGFVLQPASPWLEILAGVFGIGMGLTLDEFALWLYLEDVYWSEEGRSSVDAVIFAAIIGGGIIVGFVPLDAGSGGSTRRSGLSVVGARHLRAGRTEGKDQRGRDRHVHPAGRLGRRRFASPGRGHSGPGGAIPRAARSWQRRRRGRRATTAASPLPGPDRRRSLEALEGGSS